MTCRLSITASPAPRKGAGFGARMAFLLGLPWQGTPSAPGAGYGHVQTIATPSISDQARRDMLIQSRAIRLHNRNRENAAKFVRTHTILDRGRYFD